MAPVISAADSEIKDRITPDMNRLFQSIIPPQRMQLQPAHGPGYVGSSPQPPQAPGLDYIPRPASVVTPGLTGQSTIAGDIYRNPEISIVPPVRETAQPVGKPVGPVAPVLTSTPVPSAAQSRLDYRIEGPGYVEPSRFRPASEGGGTIVPEAPGLVNAARRQGIGIEATGPVRGGNVAVFAQSSEQQAEVAKRREEGSIALAQYNANLDRANIMEGAHGPEEAARAATKIAAIDALESKGRAAQRTAELETAKAKVSMAKDISDIQKNQFEINKKGQFEEEKDYEKNLSVLKDPGAAQWLTTARKNIHAGTHEWADNQISMYDDAGKETVPVKIQGAVPKQFRDALKGTMSEYEKAKKLLEENSGLFDSTSTYRARLLDIQNKFKQALTAYGLRIEPVDSAKL